MMTVYRITKTQYADDLSGQGAYLYGGRWNKPGTYALYTSEARSLALLELLVHFNSKAALKQNYVFIQLSIPSDHMITIPASVLGNHSNLLNNENLWRITNQHFFEKQCHAIRVPSVIIPDEYNIILNPLHPDMQKVKSIKSQPVLMDPRLLRS